MGTSRHSPTQMVAGLLRDGERVLLCHRHPERERYPDLWDLPGGRVEPGESPGEALSRELEEELGIGVQPPTCPPLTTLHLDGTEIHVYAVGTWRGDAHNAAPNEHDEIRWVPPDAISNLALAHHAYRDLLL